MYANIQVTRTTVKYSHQRYTCMHLNDFEKILPNYTLRHMWRISKGIYMYADIRDHQNLWMESYEKFISGGQLIM